MEAWITINNLQKTIDDFELGPIDLTIIPGTITALVGKNGSGKSTLLKLMMHLAKPDAGTIHLFNEPVNSPEKNWKSRVAYLPQTAIGVSILNGELLRDLTAHGYPNWDEQLFQKIVHLFQVPLNKKYNKLSQGLQKKLNLALTIACNAPLMILDEPTAYMDIPSKKILGDILMDWMDHDERSIIMTSHQVEDIRKLSDYLSILDDGKILGTFEKDALIERFKRYWIKGELPKETVPGEVSRTNGQLTTNDPEKTEQYFRRYDIDWFDRASMDLEEIITLLMTRK